MSTRPAVPIDEEGASASRSSWRIDGPEATDECRRRIFYDVDEAVAAVRAANGHAQPITVCPLTGRGTDAAARAAGDDPRIEVSDYQVWITEQAGTFRPWLIHYFGDGTRKRRTMAADSVGDALRRVRRRRPQAAVRVSAGSAAGRQEALKLLRPGELLTERHEPAWP